ncbi:MAG: pilus assembly protein PilM [bacterium]
MARNNQILGLDIGRHTAKAVLVAAKGNGVEVLRVEALRLPPGGLDRKAILARWIKECDFTGARCVISLPGQQAMFQPMFLVPDDPRTIEQVAAMEILKLRDMAAEAMSYSVASFGGSHGERRVLMAMVRPILIEESMALVRDLGLELLDILPAPVALFNALVPAHATETTLFAHVGSSTTEVAIGGPEGLMFARAFAVGGHPFTEALAKVRQLQLPQAENLKVTGGCLLDDADPAVNTVMKRVADLWISEFQSCLTVFGSLFPKPSDRPKRVVLSGGGALLAGFSNYVALKTGLEVTTDIRLPTDGKCEPPAVWAIAAGLACAGVQPRKCEVSFLPKSVRDEQMFRREKPYWMAAGVVAALILIVSLIGGYYDFKRMEKHLDSQRASLERRRELVAKIEAAQTRCTLIREMAAPVDDLLRIGPSVREVLSLVAAAKHPEDWLTLVCDGESYQSKSPSASLRTYPEVAGSEHRRLIAAVSESVTNKPARLEHIIIEGFTTKLDFSTVQSLIDRLDAGKLVATADLLSDDKLVQPDAVDGKGTDRRIKRFVIDLKVGAP